jgi:hypothetical protein
VVSHSANLGSSMSFDPIDWILDAMNRLFRIRVNRELLRSHLAREDGEVVSETRVCQQLIEAGFSPQEGDHWLVREANLGFLQPSEVEAIELVSTSGSNGQQN